MGWMANSSGVIDSSGTEVALKVPVGTTMPAKVTDNITYSNNLQSSDTLGASSQTSIDVYDSKGTAHSVDQTFVNTGTNQWLVKATVPDADGTTQNSLNLVTFGADGKYGNTSTVTGFTPNNVNFTSMGLDNTLNSVGTGYFTVIDASGNPTQYALTTTNTSSDNWSYSIANATDPSATVGSGTGTISYNGSQYVFSTPSFTYGSPAQSVTLGTPIINDTPGTTTTMASKDYTYSSGVYNNLAFGVSDGANPMSIDLLMSGLTQYGGTSTVQATDQDGYASGTLSNTTINNVGVLVGSFSNGQSQDLAQVSLATFNNPQGLDQIGDNMFSVSDNSGVPQVGVANSGGRGTFSSGTLESSNVDLATEFSNMITTENAYNANSKVISTVNQMLQQLDNLIQG
jgi:flagellar hook protein FlgE